MIGLKSRGKNRPFLGDEFPSKVRYILVDEAVVYQNQARRRCRNGNGIGWKASLGAGFQRVRVTSRCA